MIDQVTVDLNKMLQRKDKVVKTLTGGVRALMKTNKVTTLEGLGTITAPGKVSVKSSQGETTEVEAKNIVIATGSVPTELPFAKFDGQTIVSSTEALSFTEAPAKLLVIGAGAIGLELGSVWSRLGSEVTVLEFLPDRSRFRPRAGQSAAARAHGSGHDLPSGNQSQRAQG